MGERDPTPWHEAWVPAAAGGGVVVWHHHCRGVSICIPDFDSPSALFAAVGGDAVVYRVTRPAGADLRRALRWMVGLESEPMREAIEPRPSYLGSKHCKSGSIASGGRNAHCSCDTCF